MSTSSSRTAVADQAGAKTQLTGLFAALLVLTMLVVAPGLVQWLPMPVLAAVIIVAGASLLDVSALRRLWLVRRTDFGIAALCFLGVALVGVLEGIVIAVVVSVAEIFVRAWRPYWAVLGEPEGVAGFHDVSRYPEAERLPGLVILRWDAPLFFANSNVFRDAVRGLVTDTAPQPTWVVIAAEPITDIDTTAADMLVKLDEELNADGRHLVFAELKDPVRDKLERYSIYDTIDPSHFYPTIRKAVQAYREEHLEAPVDAEATTGPPIEPPEASGPPSAAVAESGPR